MTKESENTREKWYTRPVFSVTDMDRAVRYYCDLLCFRQGWKYEEAGKVEVTQVAKGDFELILTANLDRTGCGRVFISLEKDEMTDLEKTIRNNSVAFEEVFWGYPSIRLRDPDGNEMLFPKDE